MKKLTKKQREKFLNQIDNILKKYKKLCIANEKFIEATGKLERVLDKSDVEHSIKELIKEVKR